ncbi:hypothetical protein TpMuguga_03g00582 [Theileria parva strain Muguga]|uniref:Uncharacterized protein n=1 Tax=Theileria parva TaxID=5875 RepID=Q4MZB2_THEPA|nr:uncharacterized protein TpMuguga_03g00582 [Theileria parva strain Muguga]EAN31327.1 hypothetical protein TpMuguga_03g00582 [Theileria parva strain Muguga]|eukprot:XP_763610.1 hypothetical protein [Theileria parva strain Muguga]
MNLFMIIILFVAGKCLSDNIYFVMDLDLKVKSSKWLVLKQYYKGIPYYVFHPSPGYEVGSIVFKGHSLFVRPSVEVVASVFVYYVEENHGTPLILIHSHGYEHTPIVDSSTLETERNNCRKLFFDFIKENLTQNKVIQEKLKDLDSEYDPFAQPSSLNSLIYRLYKSVSYKGETPKFKEIFNSTNLRPTVKDGSFYQKEEKSETSTEIVEPSETQKSEIPTQPDQQTIDKPELQPETIVISDFSESDYDEADASESDHEETESDDEQSEPGDSQPPSKKPKHDHGLEQEIIVISDSSESDEEIQE